jgi:hypothetical protein
VQYLSVDYFSSVQIRFSKFLHVFERQLWPKGIISSFLLVCSPLLFLLFIFPRFVCCYISLLFVFSSVLVRPRFSGKGNLFPLFSTLFYSHLFFTVPKDVYAPWQWNAKVRLFLLFPSSLGVTILSMHRRAIYSIFVITDKNCSKTNLFRVTFYIHVELIIWSHHMQ